MTVAAADIISTPLDVLRTMLSNCANFQAFVQAPDAPTALTKIYPHGVQGDMARPGAFCKAGPFDPASIGGGSHSWFVSAGRLFIFIERNVQQAGVITSVTSGTVFADTGLGAFAANWFAGMSLKMISGAGDTADHIVSASANGTGQLTLATAVAPAPQVGDQYLIYAPQPDQALTPFLNSIGAILSDLFVLSGSGGNLTIRKPSVHDYGRSANWTQKNDYVGAQIELEYGI